jgi:hypothetical protein
VESVEVVAAEVAVDTPLSLKVIADHQDAVGNSNDGALPASARGKFLKLG